MGYEGHAVADRGSRRTRRRKTTQAMERLAQVAETVGGDVVSAGGTGTYDINTAATEIQAGSYALMDGDYGQARPAVHAHARDRRDGDPHERPLVGRRLRAEGDGHGPRQPDHRRRRRVVLLRRAPHVHGRTRPCASAIACSCGPRTSIRRSRTTSACTSPTGRDRCERRRLVARRPPRLGRRPRNELEQARTPGVRDDLVADRGRHEHADADDDEHHRRAPTTVDRPGNPQHRCRRPPAARRPRPSC